MESAPPRHACFLGGDGLVEQPFEVRLEPGKPGVLVTANASLRARSPVLALDVTVLGDRRLELVVASSAALMPVVNVVAHARLKCLPA